MLPMSNGAGKITHMSDLTSVKYLAAVKWRLHEALLAYNFCKKKNDQFKFWLNDLSIFW
jgi:hypothetical protein